MFWIGIIGGVIVILLVYMFNRLVRLRNLLREAQSGVDVQLKRRYDLIPELVETVKGYAGYEKKILTEITQTRAGCLGAEKLKDKPQLENQLTENIKTLFAVAESYPDLKAAEGFRSLQQSLADIEDQIQYARRYYNGTVRNYNIAVQTFPSNIMAGLFRFTREDFFEIELVTQRDAPGVEFTAKGEPV